MDKIQILESLLSEADDLQILNDSGLEAFKKKLRMIIRNVFGKESEYLKELEEITFHPQAYSFNYITGESGITKEQLEEIWLDGWRELVALVQVMIDEMKTFQPLRSEERKTSEKYDNAFQIFLVHGHDDVVKQSVARVVERLGFEPVILHEQPNRGRTIIEKFTDYSNVGFAIILLSADDIGYDAKKQPAIAQARARQNVILEMGFFLGKLGRERVFVLYPEDGKLELPSDYSGVLYTKYDAAGRWQLELVQELKATGYDVDANKLVRGS